VTLAVIMLVIVGVVMVMTVTLALAVIVPVLVCMTIVMLWIVIRIHLLGQRIILGKALVVPMPMTAPVGTRLGLERRIDDLDLHADSLQHLL